MVQAMSQVTSQAMEQVIDIFEEGSQQVLALDPFPVGTIVRYATGRTAMFRVTHVTDGAEAGRVRYFGQHCMGGLYTAPHEAVAGASALDVQIWAQHTTWRSPGADDDESSGQTTEI
jgi:hypothetical protein